MDLELGLKITKTRDDIASISEYRLAKAGPVFQSRETNTAFILTAHLKGYKKNNINIKISEDGSKISISGEKPVQNILMMGWLMHRKEVDVAGFNRVFKIPDGVKLDGIKAKYEEEEWIMNIIMPKLVKGICGVKIEEVKEEESDGRRSEQEKNEGHHIPSAVGETGQKGSKESEVQAMEDSERFMKKEEFSNNMLDDSNREKTKDTVHREVEESKVGTDGENGGSFREVGEEGCEVKKTSEPEGKVGVGTSQKIGEASQKEMKELKLKNEDGRVKTSAKGKSVGEGMPKNTGGDRRQDKELKVQEMEDNEGFVEKEKGVSEDMLDDANANIIGEVIQKEEEESKSGIKDRDGESVKEKNVRGGYKGMKISETKQNVGADVTQNIGDRIRGVSKDSVIEQIGENKRRVEKMEREEPEEMLVEANVSTERETLGESNQTQFEEHSSETEDSLKESVKKSRMEPMKAPQLDQNVNDQVPTNIGGISQEEFKESRIQWKKKTKSIEENMDEEKSEKIPTQASKDGKKHIYGKSMEENTKKPKIQTWNEDNILPKIETGNGDYDGVKAGREEFDSMETIWEEFPPKLQKCTTKEGKRLSISKMEETEDVKEAKIKTKWKENEYLEDKDEGEELIRMHKEDKKDLAKETLRENEDVKEAKDKRERKEIEYFVDKSTGEEDKRRHVEAKKDLTKETKMKKNEATMEKREDKEIECFVEARKDLTTKKIQETEDIKEEISKTKDKGFEKFEDKDQRKEPNRLYMEAQDLKEETIQENEDIQEAMLKRVGKSNEHFVDKSGEKPERMHIEPKKDITKEKLQEIEGFKEAKVKIKGKEIENFADKDECEEHKNMNMKLKRESTKETKQESENVKEAMVKRKGNETKYFVDKGEGEEPKSMHVEAKKELTAETIQEDVREGKDYESFGGKGEVEETKRMLTEPKNMAKETMQDIKGVKEAMVKRKGKEFENFADKDEAREVTKMLVKSKELTKETKQQSEKIKEAMIKRKGKETGYFIDKGEDKEPKSMYVEDKKDLTKTTQKIEEPKRMHIKPKDIPKETIPKRGVKDEMVKTKDKEIGNFVDKYDGEEHIKMLVKELPKERIKEREKVKEDMVKKKVKETEYFMEKGEDEEPINMHVEAEKDLTSKTILESEDVREEVIKTEGKDYEYFVDKKGESEELKMTNMEAKQNMGKESMQETKGEKEAMSKRKGKEIKSSAKGEGKETKKVLMEAKKDLTTVTVQENDGSNEGNENKRFSDEGEGEEPNRMYMETKKDFREETLHESENVKNEKVKSEGKNIECFADKSEDNESISMLMGNMRDLTKEEMHENDDVKETMIKRKGKEIEYLVDKSEDEVEEPKRMHIEEKKDQTTKTMHEIEDANEVMVKSKDKEIENFSDKAKGKESKIRETKKDSTKVTMKESDDDTREAMVKRKGKEVEYFVDKREEPKWMHTEAKKDLTTKKREESEVVREAMVKREGEEEMDYFLEEGEDEKNIPKEKTQIVEKIKHGIADNDQQNVVGKTTKGKSEVPTEEGPKLVGGQDGSRGLKVSNMEDPKEMAETKSLMKKVQGQKSKKSEEASRVIQKNTATEILQKETEESNNGRKFREEPNVPNNMVKVVFEVLGTFQAKLPKKMMEAIGQNKKDKNEYVIVKLKAEGSIEMHVEPNEGFDEDETEERSEKEGPKIQTMVKDQHRLQDDKKPKMGEITPEFEKASGLKQAAENMHESTKREHQMMTPKEEVEKSKKEEEFPMPKASKRKENNELSLPSKDYKIPKIEKVQQKEGKRPMHSLEATTSKEEEHAQAMATHSKEKSEIDELQVNQLPPPEMWSIEPEKHGLKEDGSKAVSLNHMQEGKEFIHSIDSTAASEVVADEEAEPSKIWSSSSTQPFEAEGKDNIDASSDDESQDSEMDSERETPQVESPEDQQCTQKALEESHGTHEIEEENADEQVDESDEKDSEQLEEQKECEEEAIGGKKNQKRSKKMIVSSIIAGSALLASGIFLVIRHRRSTKGAK